MKLTERNRAIQEMMCDGNSIVNFYRFVAQNPHIPLHDACQIIIQRPNAGVCFTFDEWKALNRRVTQGRKGIPYYDQDNNKYFAFDVVDTHGEKRFNRPIVPVKKILDGLDLLNDTEIAGSSRGDYRIILSGVVNYLGQNGYFTDGDEDRNRLIAEGVACSLYNTTAFPKMNGIHLMGYKYDLQENAELFRNIQGFTSFLMGEIDIAIENKAREVPIIDDTEEDYVSDEVPVAFIEPEKVLVHTHSAIYSQYEGYVVLLRYTNPNVPDSPEEVYLGKTENYDNRGTYDNTDKSLIFVSENGNMFKFLSKNAEWTYTQEEMVQAGYFIEADYQEYDRIVKGTLVDYERASVPMFGVNIEQKGSGEPFRYPDWKTKPKGNGMYQQYNAAEKEYPQAIVLMRLGDFYEIMGEKAKNAAEILNLTLTSRDVGLDERIPMCGFPYHVTELYIEKLLKTDDVVVLEGDEEPKYIVKRQAKEEEIAPIEEADEPTYEEGEEEEIEEETDEDYNEEISEDWKICKGNGAVWGRGYNS